jgi:hypothetical protein
MDMFTQGFIAAATVLYLFSYFNIRRILGFALIIDIVVTGGLIYMFAGSYAGMMTGVIAGLIVSMSLRIGRTLVGVERPTIARRKGNILPSFFWVRSK